MNKIIVVTGQTATGKSSLAYELAIKHKGALISADSRQIYTHLNIVTGKAIFNDVATHLLDIIDPKEPFSSAQWVNLARKSIEDIIKSNKTPIIVGGTYLYLKHLLYGLDSNVGPNWQLREELNVLPVEKLQEKLLTIAPQIQDNMNHSDWNNPRRLIRRIEILSHSRLSAGRKESQTPRPDPSVAPLPQDDNPTRHPEYISGSHTEIIGLRFADDEKLRTTIEKRVRARLAAGAIKETRNLLSMGYKREDPGLQTIGYKHIIQFLGKEISEEEMITLWITAEVQYAKRQYTFMKTDSTIAWQTV